MLHLFIIDSEAAFRSLFIKRRNIAACLIHSYYYFIEGDAVASVGEGGIDVSVESAGCGEGVTFDTRYLDEAAYGVASHSEVMFESHLGSIFYLGDAATEQLACCAGRHRTGNAHPTSAPDIDAFDFTMFPISPAVANALMIRISSNS